MALSYDQINSLYRDVFKRDVDPAGLAFWQSQEDVTHPDTMYQRMLYTPEGRQRMIEDVYKSTLNRGADQPGLQHWLNSGLDRQGIEAGLRASDEYAPTRRASEVNATLAQDPAYNAYRRNSDMQLAEIENRRLGDQERMRAMEGIQYGKFDLGEGRSYERLNNNYGSRGLYRSGARLRDQGRVTADYGQQRNSYALSQAQQMSDMQAKSASEQSRISRERDDQEVAARNRLYERDAKGAHL